MYQRRAYWEQGYWVFEIYEGPNVVDVWAYLYDIPIEDVRMRVLECTPEFYLIGAYPKFLGRFSTSEGPKVLSKLRREGKMKKGRPEYVDEHFSYRPLV